MNPRVPVIEVHHTFEEKQPDFTTERYDYIVRYAKQDLLVMQIRLEAVPRRGNPEHDKMVMIALADDVLSEYEFSGLQYLQIITEACEKAAARLLSLERDGWDIGNSP